MTRVKEQVEPSKFQPGDRVVLIFGEHRADATVTEDRGPLGIGGRRLYRVRLVNGNDPEEPTELELPAEQIELAETHGSRAAKSQQQVEPSKFRPGDRVVLICGGNRAEALVTEDRGPIGIGGRRLYRVRIPQEEELGGPTELELPAEQIELAND